MNLEDIKNTIYDSFVGTSGMSFWDVAFILAYACLVGLYIYLIYKNFTKVEFYSKDLNIAIAGVVIVTAAILVAMQSSLVVSLGMVGALSIVRFRTAIKSPIDLLFLFWAVSEGIICGVALYMLGATLCIIMTILLFILNRIPYNRANSLLIIKADTTLNQEEVSNKIKSISKYSKNVSTVIKNNQCELIYEVEAKDNISLVNSIKDIEGVNFVNIVEHSSDTRI